MLVEAKPGAAGAIGSQHMASARPDDHTMGLTFIALVQAPPAFGIRTPYGPVKDFVPVARLSNVPLVLLTGDMDITSMATWWLG